MLIESHIYVVLSLDSMVTATISNRHLKRERGGVICKIPRFRETAVSTGELGGVCPEVIVRNVETMEEASVVSASPCH